MKKNLLLTLCLFVSSLFLMTGCKDKEVSVSEQIRKTWIAELVKHDNVQVYVKGGTSNTATGYSNFKLMLGANGVATLTEVDNKTFTGKWAVESDTRLKLTELGPEAPTGTNGTIEFTIRSIEGSRVILVRTTENIKTGNTRNEYTLVVE